MAEISARFRPGETDEVDLDVDGGFLVVLVGVGQVVSELGEHLGLGAQGQGPGQHVRPAGGRRE